MMDFLVLWCGVGAACALLALPAMRYIDNNPRLASPKIPMRFSYSPIELILAIVCGVTLGPIAAFSCFLVWGVLGAHRIENIKWSPWWTRPLW